MTWKNYILIIPAAHAELARALAKSIAPGDSAKDILTTPLASSLDPLTTTHYISAGMIQEEFALLLGKSAAVKTANDASAKDSREAASIDSIQEMFAAGTFIDSEATGISVETILESMNLVPLFVKETEESEKQEGEVK